MQSSPAYHIWAEKGMARMIGKKSGSGKAAWPNSRAPLTRQEKCPDKTNAKTGGQHLNSFLFHFTRAGCQQPGLNLY